MYGLSEGTAFKTGLDPSLEDSGLPFSPIGLGASTLRPELAVSPGDLVRRRVTTLPMIRVETLHAFARNRLECDFEGACPLLIAYHDGSRIAGATELDGCLSSRLRDVGRKLCFVPAGARFSDWHEPRTPVRATLVYFDVPASHQDAAAIRFPPARLFFEHQALWQTVEKLAALVDSVEPSDAAYAAALALVLFHELTLLDEDKTAATADARRGGLTGWQANRVKQLIDEDLARPIALAQLAATARLSPYHFSRAFKQSFGMPPHRYHLSRRVERAKSLLAETSRSITEIALELGFCESSAFTATFRRLAGQTPTQYRRSFV
jgi:AraC family transcriptional regulator